jgi:hypothetical protein
MTKDQRIEKMKGMTFEEKLEFENYYDFENLMWFDSKLSDETIEKECNDLGVSQNSEGLEQIREIFNSLGGLDMSQNTDKKIYLVHVYTFLYSKLIRDNFDLSDIYVFGMDVEFNYVLGVYNGNLLVLSPNEIHFGLLNDSYMKSIPRPSEITFLFKEYIERFEGHHGVCSNQIFLYDMGQIIPFKVGKIRETDLERVNEFIRNERSETRLIS